MNTKPIPKIIEGTNPGFQKYTATDFAEPPEETDQQKCQRATLLEEVKAEQNRLSIDDSNLEFLVHHQTGSTRLTDLPLFDVMMFRDYLRRLDSRQLQIVGTPPYLDFVFATKTLYMGGNNKELIGSWVHFLVKSHTFAASGSWDMAANQRFLKPVKYEAIIKEVASVDALRWIEKNFDSKKHPPYHPIAEWKRPDPIVTPKQTEPT